MKTEFCRKTFLTGIIIALLIGIAFTVKSFPVNGKSIKNYMYMHVDDRVLSFSENALLYVRGKGSTRIDFRIWKFNPNLYYRSHGSLSLCLERMPENAKLIQEFSEYPRLKKAGEEFSVNIKIHPEGPGGYLIKARDNEGREVCEWFLVTELGLITKQSQDKLLVYACAFDKGEPQTGVDITVYDGSMEVIGKGITDGNGFYILNAKDIPEGGISIVGTKGDPGTESFAEVKSWNYWENAGYNVYIYTDRPIYRPGQKVSWKGILRESTGGGFKVLGGEEISVEIRDPKDACIYKIEAETNNYGSFTGDVILGDEPSLGTYRVLVKVRGSVHYGRFKVAEYRKPEYEIKVNTDKQVYIAGDDISCKIEAAYYFGKPVPDGKVKYAVYSQTYYRPFRSTEDLGYFSITDDDYGYYGELVDSGEGVTSGDGTMEFTIKTGRTERTKRLFIETTVTDESHREVTGRASIILARGLFDLTAQPTEYIVSPGGSAEIHVKGVTLEEKPYSVEFTWQSMRITWDGNKSIRWKEQSGVATTGIDGKGVFEFTPEEEGSYVVEVSATDARGNHIVEEAYIWVASSTGRQWNYGGTEIEIVSDKDVYELGDTAKILVNTTLDDTWAIITVEGRDLLFYEALKPTGCMRLFEIPITEEFCPNCFFTVTLVRGKQFYSREKTIYVSMKDKFLDVSIIPDKEIYSPGEKGSYTIKIRDHKGRPVQAELSLGVVDASIYAVQKELAPDIRKAFYGSVWNMTVTNYSFPQWYFGGADKEGDASEIRKDFPDTALWEPIILTDKKGTARINFQMPDSLTTWKATVRAHTRETQVGFATNDVITTKDFICRLSTPRFFTLGDTAYVSTIIHNYTENRVNAEVKLRAEGITLCDKDKRTVVLSAGEQVSLDWKVICDKAGIAKFTVLAKAGRAQDALELSVPVIPFGRSIREFKSGEIGDSPGNNDKAHIEFNIPEDVLDNTTDVEVRLAPSVAATALGALEYLTSYPYGCVEQTMNSFLPNIIVSGTLGELGIEIPEITKDLPKMVEAGLARIYRYQHYEGGWGWWEFDKPNSRMTAYAVYGLELAKRAGFNVDEEVFMRGRRALGNFLDTPRNVDDLIYNLFVMSETGEKALPRLDEMILRKREASNYSLALLALTLKNIGRQDDAALLCKDLLRLSRSDGISTYWESSVNEWYWADNRVETTAYALLAMLSIDPGNPRASQVVRWLSGERLGIAWNSTKDTAIAVMALTEYMKVHGDLGSNVSAAIELNGRRVKGIKFTQKNLWDKEQIIKIDPSQLVKGKNELIIEKTGEGRLYYSVASKYYTPSEIIMPEEGGLRVRRGYYYKTQDDSVYEPVTGPVKPGDEIIVRITIKTESPQTYIMIEDPVPSGFEVVDTSYDIYSWDFWYGRKEIHDTKVAVFSAYLEEGENEIIYSIRAERPGEYKIMPTKAWGMYAPDIYGSSESSEIVCQVPVLAAFSTTVKESELNRNHNIALASSVVNGSVIQPGEIFSLDKALGPRSESNGYKNARILSGGKSLPGTAGGICQVSTTLYNVALRAGLEIIERHPHSQPIDYVSPGLDATISDEAGLDLQFKNRLDVPLIINMHIEGARLIAEIKGKVSKPQNVYITTEILNVERPRLLGDSSDDFKVSGGRNGIRVAVWRTMDTCGTIQRELISEDYYKPIHALAWGMRQY